MDSIRTLQKKRTSNFREDETKLLIQLWGSPFIQNKLYLTHRKGPVMRILATKMQQNGFYRTPDEIKTRIRNLKCLYHRIKRTTTSGTGIGIVDPDWPHYKAMDAILNNEGQKKMNRACLESALEGPRCEDIKQEIDIDINDDMESWATTDSLGSEANEEPAPLPPPPASTGMPILKPVSSLMAKPATSILTKNGATVIPSFTIPAQGKVGAPGTVKPGQSIPVPLLIFNSLQPGQDKKATVVNASSAISDKISNDLGNTLKELLQVQKDHLEIKKQKLELTKKKYEFERVVGTQLLTVVPMIGTILQRITKSDDETVAEKAADRKRKRPENVDVFKNSKILRNILKQSIRKYMMGEEDSEEDDKDSDDDYQGATSSKRRKFSGGKGGK